jgi:hypothetical protein
VKDKQDAFGHEMYDCFMDEKQRNRIIEIVERDDGYIVAESQSARYLSAYKIDLKCMQDKNYRKLGGTLQNTLDTIKRAHEIGLWVEIVTLAIPGFNDSNEELWEAARSSVASQRISPGM